MTISKKKVQEIGNIDINAEDFTVTKGLGGM